MTSFWDQLHGREPAPAEPPTPAPPVRPAADGIHPYAAAIRAAWCDRLTRLKTKPWVKGDAWDTNCYTTARKLTELANSPWAGYSPAQARADYMFHAPHDQVWDQRNKCWDRGSTDAGNDTIPEPPPGITVPDVTVLPAPDPSDLLDEHTEAEFWQARGILQHIHAFARARRAAPWAVLGVVLARIITATPFTVCLPPIIGGRGSLNSFVGLVGPSGAGKGAATMAAVDAIHIQGVKTVRLASGEAIAHLYKKRLTKTERDAGESDWIDPSHARLVDVSEIDRFAAQTGRQGSTLMADLRAAWSGEILGQIAADPTRSFILEPHQYRLAMVAGIQPHRAQVLLADEDGGTPQRFVWLPVQDPDAPSERPACPEPLMWTPPQLSQVVGINGAQMDVDPTIVTEIDASRLTTLRGNGDPLDGHLYQCRLKVAAALGLAERRVSVTTEDWALADIIMRKSAATRSSVVDTLYRRTVDEGRKRAEADAARAIVVEERVIDAAVKRVCTVIVKKLRRNGSWVTHADLRRAITSHDRKHFEDALRRLHEAGQIEFDADVTRGGKGAYQLVGEDR